MIIPNDKHIKVLTNIMIHILNNKLSEIILKYYLYRITMKQNMKYS